jgi:hypothetical protein
MKYVVEYRAIKCPSCGTEYVGGDEGVDFDRQGEPAVQGFRLDDAEIDEWVQRIGVSMRNAEARADEAMFRRIFLGSLLMLALLVALGAVYYTLCLEDTSDSSCSTLLKKAVRQAQHMLT